MSDREAVEQFERRLREDYQGLYPRQCGWESAALHLLLAYDFYARQSPDNETVDKLKYPLMHALRWGADTPSQPLGAIPAEADATLLSQCWDVLHRASDYTGVFGAFRLFDSGVTGLDTISERTVSFKANPGWMAYDELEQRLQEQPRLDRNRPEMIASVNRVVNTVLSLYSDHRDYYPNIGEFRSALTAVRHLATEGFELPNSWSFDGIALADLRSFWMALMLLGMVHNAVSHRLVGSQSPHLCQLAIRRKDRLTGWLAACLGLEAALVGRLIDLHCYSREHVWADIALTPLLPIGANLIAFSPWLILSSRFERNFCAFNARNHKLLYDANSNLLASSMASRLVEAFTRAGFHAKASLPIQTTKGSTDIDLLVWSPDERYVLAAELVWITATADIVEVLRAEEKCIEKLNRQIPKYREAVSEHIGQLLQRAFALKERPAVDGSSCTLIARGFVGSPRLVTDQSLFVAEQLALEQIAVEHSLKFFCEWVRAIPYLPVEGRDFRPIRMSVTSPSGYQATFWERDRTVAAS